jgi:hypothetical protein
MPSSSTLSCDAISEAELLVVNPLLDDIRKLGAELAKRRFEFSRHIVSDHKSAPFINEEVIPFVKGMAKLRDHYRPQIKEIADRISRLGGRGWEKNENIVKLWNTLRIAIQELSEHPDDSKKVSAIIVSRNNRMIAWGVNQIPDGLPRYGHYYVKGLRKDFIVCAERMATALGVKIPLAADRLFKRLKDPERQNEETRRIVRAYSKQTADAAKRENHRRERHREHRHNLIRLSGSTLFVRAPSCHDCRPVVKAGNFKAIAADKNGGNNFTRSRQLKINIGKRGKLVDMGRA